MVEEVYGRRGYMREKRKFEEYRGVNRGIQTRKNRSKTTGENRKKERSR